MRAWPGITPLCSQSKVVIRAGDVGSHTQAKCIGDFRVICGGTCHIAWTEIGSAKGTKGEQSIIKRDWGPRGESPVCPRLLSFPICTVLGLEEVTHTLLPVGTVFFPIHNRFSQPEALAGERRWCKIYRTNSAAMGQPWLAVVPCLRVPPGCSKSSNLEPRTLSAPKLMDVFCSSPSDGTPHPFPHSSETARLFPIHSHKPPALSLVYWCLLDVTGVPLSLSFTLARSCCCYVTLGKSLLSLNPSVKWSPVVRGASAGFFCPSWICTDPQC